MLVTGGKDSWGVDPSRLSPDLDTDFPVFEDAWIKVTTCIERYHTLEELSSGEEYDVNGNSPYFRVTDNQWFEEYEVLMPSELM